MRSSRRVWRAVAKNLYGVACVVAARVRWQVRARSARIKCSRRRREPAARRGKGSGGMWQARGKGGGACVARQ